VLGRGGCHLTAMESTLAGEQLVPGKGWLPLDSHGVYTCRGATSAGKGVAAT
jgi:hypothetical protein